MTKFCIIYIYPCEQKLVDMHGTHTMCHMHEDDHAADAAWVAIAISPPESAG